MLSQQAPIANMGDSTTLSAGSTVPRISRNVAVRQVANGYIVLRHGTKDDYYNYEYAFNNLADVLDFITNTFKDIGA